MKNPLAVLFGNDGGFLKSPGDKMSAEVTKTGRHVMKIKTKEHQVSVVKYPNGATVETKVTRKK